MSWVIAALRNLDNLDKLVQSHASKSYRNGRFENVDQNQIIGDEVGAESVLESFPSGSSSNSYTPSAMASAHGALETVIMDGQSGRQNFQITAYRIDPLISLLREQIDENANLKVRLSDLEATVADLRDRLYEKDKLCQECKSNSIE